MADSLFSTREWWLCGECLHVASSDTWGGNADTAICPKCGFVHRDDEGSWIEAGTEIEMQRSRQKALTDV